MNKEAVGTLTGKAFHSVKADRETIEWQGTFLGLASPGLYKVQIYNWATGEPSQQRLVPATDMRYWLIYDTAGARDRYYYDVYLPALEKKEEQDNKKATSEAK
jgi:hypothetical protein